MSGRASDPDTTNAITNPMTRPTPPMTETKPIVVRRTASFTAWIGLVMRTAPMSPGSTTGAAATMMSDPSVLLNRISAAALGAGA